MSTDVRDVWVADRFTHVPAHRIPADAVPTTDDPITLTPVVCPPGVAPAGYAITRAEAARLQVHPCVRCFRDVLRSEFTPTADRPGPAGGARNPSW